jgi:hypothetical protein
MMTFQSAVAPALDLFVLSKQANHNIEVIVAGIDEPEEGPAILCIATPLTKGF